MPSTEDIIAAIHQADTETIEALLLADPGLARTHHGLSPILTALHDRQDDLAELLEEHNSELTIFEAAALGSYARINALLDENPACINTLADDGWAPLHLACFFHQPATVIVLLDGGADLEIVSANPTAVTPLQSALASGAGPVARTLLERGANIHVPGWTPLHYAAANNLPDIAELLISMGAEMNTTNPDGDTPLTLAIRLGRRETAAILEEHGARA